jgi:hypothetical protein
MKMPWTGKTGLAKAVAFFATLLVVSLGLCGVNFFAVLKLGNPTQNASVLMITAWVELAGIIAGILGLVVVAVIVIATALAARFRKSQKKK